MAAGGRLRALLFDLDGTIAETEELHRVAFNATFAAAGLPWHWDQATYGRLLHVAGGRERLEHHARDAGPEAMRAPQGAARLADLHADKTARLAAMLDDAALALPARPGVARLMAEARAAGVAVAVVTTSQRAVAAKVLARALGPLADAIGLRVCGDDVTRKKPDPEAYHLALERLGVAAVDAVAVEDSLNGVRAARAAGIACLATRSLYTRADPLAEAGAALVLPDLDTPPQSVRTLGAVIGGEGLGATGR